MNAAIFAQIRSSVNLVRNTNYRRLALLAILNCANLPSQAEPSTDAKIAWHTLGLLGGIALKLRNPDCCVPKLLAGLCNYCATGQPAYPYEERAGLAFSAFKALAISLGIALSRQIGHALCTPKRTGQQATDSQAVLHYLCVYLGAYVGAKGPDLLKFS